MEWGSDMLGEYGKPAVFLDRDGVITREKSYVTSLKELEIFSYARACIERIHEKGYLAIIITNQSGVARGMFTEEELSEMNNYLIGQTGADAIYYCPHHPDGKVQRYRCVCNCRKPRTGMLEAACRDFVIDMQNSYMIGDRAGDILTGKNAGLRTILLESGYGTERLECQVLPDYNLQDLRDIIDIL